MTDKKILLYYCNIKKVKSLEKGHVKRSEIFF